MTEPPNLRRTLCIYFVNLFILYSFSARIRYIHVASFILYFFKDVHAKLRVIVTYSLLNVRHSSIRGLRSKSLAQEQPQFCTFGKTDQLVGDECKF